jgi:hypothetical protein
MDNVKLSKDLGQAKSRINDSLAHVSFTLSTEAQLDPELAEYEFFLHQHAEIGNLKEYPSTKEIARARARMNRMENLEKGTEAKTIAAAPRYALIREVAAEVQKDHHDQKLPRGKLIDEVDLRMDKKLEELKMLPSNNVRPYGYSYSTIKKALS